MGEGCGGMGRGAVTVSVVFLNQFALCGKCMQKELK